MLLGRHSVSVNAGGRSALLPWRAERACFPRQTRTITDRVAEPSFPGRPGPAPTSGRALSQNGCHTVWAPLRGNVGGMGAFGGPFSPRGRPLFPRKAGRASFLAMVTNPWAQGRPVTGQTWTSTDRGAEPSFPGRQSALSQGRPRPARPGPAQPKVAEPSFPDMASTGVG
jgi:hypothetical protein